MLFSEPLAWLGNLQLDSISNEVHHQAVGRFQRESLRYAVRKKLREYLGIFPNIYLIWSLRRSFREENGKFWEFGNLRGSPIPKSKCQNIGKF